MTRRASLPGSTNSSVGGQSSPTSPTASTASHPGSRRWLRSIDSLADAVTALVSAVNLLERYRRPDPAAAPPSAIVTAADRPIDAHHRTRGNSLLLNAETSISRIAILSVFRTSAKGFDMKKLAAVLVMAASGMALAPMAVAPMAQADVCAAAGGRHVAVGGCTNVAGDVAAVAIASQDYPYVPNEIPCYTAEGVPYYTPPGDPC